MLTRRNLVTRAAALAASSFVKPSALKGLSASASTEKRPNILIFMPDQTQGQTNLPGFPCHTPNVDRLASQGVLFSNAYCPTPHCCPSRASFQTGLYPSEHGVFNNVDNDSAIHTNPYPGTRYFGEFLRTAGYELDYTGKWHVGRDVTPWDAGWTNSYSKPPDTKSPYIPGRDRRKSRWKEAEEELSHPEVRQPGEAIRPGWGNRQLYTTLNGPGPFGSTPYDSDPITAGMKKMQRLVATGKPWALMVSNGGAHDPYRAPKQFVEMYDPKSIDLPPNFRDTLADKPRIYQRMRYQYWDQLSDDEVRRTIQHYRAKVTMQDALFGLLLKALDETGQADHTIVVYVSDHGDYAGAHGLWAKGVPSFREGYNIPCVIRWPHGIRNPGRQSDALVSTTDFAPTFLEAAGVPSSQYRMSGASLLPWLHDENPSGWRDTLFTQLNGVELYYTQRIVMTKDHKYVYNGFDYDELYDLTNDPHEMRNLAFPNLDLARSQVERANGLQSTGSNLPWPPLPANEDRVRRDLLSRMWEFARKHKDGTIFDPYITVAMAPYGPAVVP